MLRIVKGSEMSIIICSYFEFEFSVYICKIVLRPKLNFSKSSSALWQVEMHMKKTTCSQK